VSYQFSAAEEAHLLGLVGCRDEGEFYLATDPDEQARVLALLDAVEASLGPPRVIEVPPLPPDPFGCVYCGQVHDGGVHPR
jgi:hypothetical protein